MTDNEIIKALECCSTYKGKCTDCPAFVKVDRSNCKQVLLGAIEIINRQREEIEKRERGLQFLQETIGKNESRWLGIVAEQRAEAIKEFLTEAKEQAYVSSDWSHGEHPLVVEWDDLEEVAEGMVGADNAE